MVFCVCVCVNEKRKKKVEMQCNELWGNKRKRSKTWTGSTGRVRAGCARGKDAEEVHVGRKLGGDVAADVAVADDHDLRRVGR